jgi:hypothetical protein
MSSPDTTQIEPSSPWSILEEACGLVGLDPSGAKLIKFTNNAVFALADAPVIVRIPGSQPISDRVEKVVSVARWLADHDMPSVRLIAGAPQAISIHGRKVTFWQKVDENGPQPTGRDLGLILRLFHALPTPTFVLPQWQPLLAIRHRIAAQDVLSSQDHNFLEEKCDEIEAALGEISYFLPPGPIHGDSFMGNLIANSSGPKICDFDSASIGPREWDLTPVAVGRLRFTYAGDPHSALAETYGTNILNWQGFSVLRQTRELQLVTSVLPVLNINTSLREQWRYRFTSFRNGDLDAIWTPYK